VITFLIKIIILVIRITYYRFSNNSGSNQIQASNSIAYAISKETALQYIKCLFLQSTVLLN